MTRYYRDDGFESVSLVANLTGAGTGINAPTAGNSIFLRENDANGAIIFAVGAGNCNLPSTIKTTGAIYSTAANNTSIFYYIDSTN